MIVQVRVIRRVIRRRAVFQAQCCVAGWEAVAQGDTEDDAIANLRRILESELRARRERLVEIDVSTTPDPH